MDLASKNEQLERRLETAEALILQQRERAARNAEEQAAQLRHAEQERLRLRQEQQEQQWPPQRPPPQQLGQPFDERAQDERAPPAIAGEVQPSWQRAREDHNCSYSSASSTL